MMMRAMPPPMVMVLPFARASCRRPSSSPFRRCRHHDPSDGGRAGGARRSGLRDAGRRAGRPRARRATHRRRRSLVGGVRRSRPPSCRSTARTSRSTSRRAPATTPPPTTPRWSRRSPRRSARASCGSAGPLPYPTASIDGSPRTDLYLLDLPGPEEDPDAPFGYANTDPDECPSCRAAPGYVVLDNDFAGYGVEPDVALRATLAHELGHLSHFATAPWLESWAYRGHRRLAGAGPVSRAGRAQRLPGGLRGAAGPAPHRLRIRQRRVRPRVRRLRLEPVAGRPLRRRDRAHVVEGRDALPRPRAGRLRRGAGAPRHDVRRGVRGLRRCDRGVAGRRLPGRRGRVPRGRARGAPRPRRDPQRRPRPHGLPGRRSARRPRPPR